MKKYITILEKETTKKDILKMLEHYTKKASTLEAETEDALNMVDFNYGLYTYTLNILNNKLICNEWNTNEDKTIFILNVKKLQTVASVLNYLSK